MECPGLCRGGWWWFAPLQAQVGEGRPEGLLDMLPLHHVVNDAHMFALRGIAIKNSFTFRSAPMWLEVTSWRPRLQYWGCPGVAVGPGIFSLAAKQLPGLSWLEG